MNVLFINSCMKPGDESRTKRLCNIFIEELKKKHPDYCIEEIELKKMDLKPYYFERVERRYELLNNKDYSNPEFDLANRFAQADRIIIGAPYWDLAFPSILKIYIEHIFVGGITYAATEKGLVGLSKADKAVFIQTAGGFVGKDDPGTEYLGYVLKTLGVNEFQSVCSDFIDVEGSDVEKKLEETAAVLKKIAAEW